MNTRDKGKNWEDIAEAYLRKNGYRILERNFLCKGGELDIVALREGELVFVEVRGLKSSHFLSPAETISRSKMRRIIRAASVFLTMHALKKINSIRFDVISVDGETSDVTEHIEGAFDLETAGFDSLTFGGLYA